MPDSKRYLLEMQHITKAFPPVTALADVTFAARAGSVHALCGENGAGKSTLMKVLSGVHQPDGGKIIIDGVERYFTSPGDALNAGISMLYQELELAEHLTVYENVFLGREILAHRRFHTVDNTAEIQAVEAMLAQYHFNLDVRAPIRNLSPGECQIVELMKELMRNARIIVMDEPTSSLSDAEARSLFRVIRELRAKNLVIIYISHRMEEVLDLADDISVLRDGRVVASAPASELNIGQIVRHMVGREIDDFYPRREPRPGPVRIQIEGLSAKQTRVHDVSFSVRAGEIVGMAGLVGAGRSETARLIFGCDARDSGRVLMDGVPLDIRNPRDAIRAGIAFLTEDRKRTGLCTNLPCSWNVTLPNYENIGMSMLLDLNREDLLCRKLGSEVRVKWSEPSAAADSLSGGNQQKVLLARWLLADSKFMIFDEPTRGIDVGAKKEIYTLLNQLALEGRALLVISSELPELFGICDRILVMRDGRLVADLATDKTTPEEIMRFAALENSSEPNLKVSDYE